MDILVKVFIFVLSTVGTSYCYKTSARVNIQSFGLLLPYLLGPSLAYFLSGNTCKESKKTKSSDRYLRTDNRLVKTGLDGEFGL